MIQDLFTGNTSELLNPDPNLPISTPTEPSPSPSSTTTTTAAAAADAAATATKLRCPRCDSSHTKFCYYNNYNLTQPRHFCKTCRRYWTKGGALRNVPIGGGCRKNKNTTISTAVAKPVSAAGKLKAAVSSELGKSTFFNGFEHDQSTHNPIIWAAAAAAGPPPTSHLLSLFRNPNPNPSFTSNPLTTHFKDQNFMAGSNMGSLGFEPLCSSLWRNNQQDHHDPTATNYYHHHDHHDQTVPLILGSSLANTSSSTTSSTILDSAPVGDLGFWNQTLPWATSDVTAANGAYP